VVLPEATLTPFGTDLRRAAETRHEDFARLLEELADEHSLVVVAGSFSPADDGRVHNTVLVRGPGGTPRLEYRKIHLFDAFDADESATVAPGGELVTFDLDGTRFGLATCYDMRFPEQFAALARRGAQAIVLPTAWAAGPGKREQLQLLLRARALDSTTVILAADQSPPAGYAGRAPRGIGRSAAVGPLGRIRQELGLEPGLLMVDLDLAEIEAARAALPVLRHAVPLPEG
jgi:predicted amidohydrolase